MNFSSWTLSTWNTLLSTTFVNNSIAELKLKCSETVDIDVSTLILKFIDFNISSDRQLVKLI